MIEEACQSGPNYAGLITTLVTMAAVWLLLLWRQERSKRIALEWLRDNPGKYWPPTSGPWPAPPPPPRPEAK